jgi:TonB-dependent starch-binding outer membrane protein SusC
MKHEFFCRKHFWYFARITLTMLLSFLFIDFSIGQERTITGVITDAGGLSLPGVNIVIKGSTAGTVTDLEGKYSLKIPGDDAILSISYVGYISQEIKVEKQTLINITLNEETTQLNEVIVIGYGTQKKKLTTGANLHVGYTEIEKMHSLRIEQALQGVAPGVQITANSGQPGEALKVRIRGVSTVGNSDPIYIVDGTPVQDINYINPSDIESVDVLKDAASAAIYGTRAANGVLLITTKKGSVGGMRVSIDAYGGIQNTPKKLSLLNNQQYALIQKEKIEYTGFPDSRLTYTSTRHFIDSITSGPGTNWMDYLFRKNAPHSSITFNISGANDKSSYSSSISYFQQAGIIGNPGQSDFERISARINTENKLYKDIFRVGENLVYTHSIKKGLGVADIYNSVVRGFANTSPTFPAYDNSKPDSIDNFGKSPWPDESNPIGDMTYKYINNTKTDQVVGDIYAEIEVIKGLRLKTDYGIDFSYKNYNEFQPKFKLSPIDLNTYPYALQSIDLNYTSNFENNITYFTSINNHNITILVGNTVWQFNKYYVYGKKYGLIFDDFDHAILDNGTIDSTQKANGTKLDKAMLSYYGRLNYNYNEKYLLSLSFRRDGSSKFGPNNRWGNFPAASVGWIISQEDFMKFNGLDFLKLRASWGRNGNDQIPDFLYEATVSSQYRNYYFGSQENKAYGTSPDFVPNPDLKWEQSEQLDFGIDTRFLKHFALAFDWYNKKTIDLLVNVPLQDIAGAGNTPGPTGTKVYRNGGDVQNKGFEVDLSYQKNNGDFKFKIEANLAYNKNEVTKINNSEGIIHGDPSVLFNGCDEIFRAQTGYPIGYFYGYKSAGIFQNDSDVVRYKAVDNNGEFILDKKGKQILIQPSAKPGDIKFVDVNLDGKINGSDRIMIGDPNPDFTYGINFNAEYKGFDFSISAQGVYGNQIVYNLRVKERDFANYSTAILDRFHGEGTSNKMPRVTLTSYDKNQNFQKVSDAVYVYDGSFLKIRSINFGYDFSTSLLKGKIKRCRLYVSALNVLTITKYPGLDPEVGWGPYNKDRYENFGTGIDIGYYPLPVSYLAGLQVTF